jgi:hypothetical protein
VCRRLRRRLAEHFPDFLNQARRAERLLEKLRFRVEHSVLADGAVGIARHVEDAGLRILSPVPPRITTSVNSRWRGSRHAVDDLQGLVHVVGQEYLVAV